MGDSCSKCFRDGGDGQPSRPPRPMPLPGPESPEPGLRNAVGSQVLVYKQDPSQAHIGVCLLWLPFDLRTGPISEDVVIRGMPRPYRATDNYDNFLYEPESDPAAFDAVHTLSVVQHVLWMFRRMLQGKGPRRRVNWLWGTSPIQVFPHAGREWNAHYSRAEKALKFYFSSVDGAMVYSCRSWDIVAHEAGHAVLDALQPGWLTSHDAYTGALHEAFGDITAIFSVLDQLDMCELVVAHTKGNIHERSNFLAALGEEFGHGTGQYYGIRNAAEDLHISQVSEEVHELSKVFTGAVYDILVRIFEVTLHLAEFQPAETLHRAGRHVLSVFLLSVLDAPRKNATFEDIALLMIKKEPQEVFKGFIREEFTRREVFNEWARPQSHRTQFLAERTPHSCGTHHVCSAHASSADNNHQINAGQSFPSHDNHNIFQHHQHSDYSNKGSTSHQSVHHTRHALNNIPQSNLNQTRLQYNQTHKQRDTTPSSSLGHRRAQARKYLDHGDRGSLSHRKHIVQKQLSQPSSDKNKNILNERNIRQHLLHQHYVDNRLQRLPGSDATNTTTHHRHKTLGDQVWESQSATYSDNVFESTEI